MKNYWSYSQKDKSEMSEDTVKSLLDVELMEKGVLKVNPPQLKPVEEIDMKKKTYFEVGGVYFESAEQAEKFLALKPLKHDYDYSVGYDYKHAKPIDKEIVPTNLCNKQDLLKLKAVLSKSEEAKKYNETVTAEYKKQAEKMEKVVQNLWNDYYFCQRKAKDHQKVLNTREEYLKLTGGDAKLVRTFLLKVFDPQAIEEAEKWFGIKDESKL